MEASEPSNVGSNVYSFPRDIEAGMEQKKILWIVVAVGVFVLVIFGTALILYSPSRSSGTATAVANERLQGTAPVRRIDPDDWVRNPDSTPNLDSELPPPRGDVNVTIVNGDNASAQYGVLDVTGLTRKTARTTVPAGTEVPAEIPGATRSAEGTTSERGATDAPSTEKPKRTQPSTETATSSAKATGSAKTSGTAAKPATSKPSTAKAGSTAERPAPKKPVTVTEYWIQTGSFTGKINAENARAKLAERYINAEIFTKSVKDATSYRVRVGPYKTKKEAEYWLGTIKALPEFASSYVSEVKAKK